jgi:capsid portal protein
METEQYTFTATMPLPDFVQVEEGVVSAMIISETEEGVTSSEINTIDVQKLLSQGVAKDVASVGKSLREKSMEKSNQTLNELNHTTVSNSTFEQRIQPMPYDPDCFANFLEISHIQNACVKKKIEAALGRKYLIKPQFPVQKSAEDSTEDDFIITPEEYRKDFRKVTNFIKNCNQDKAFEDLLKLVGMDRQGIGWAAFEVVREASGKAARLYRIPATRLRVLEGFDGFVEVTGFDANNKRNTYRYYQRFGDKVVVNAPDPFDFTDSGKTVKRPYNPEEDGELQIGERNISWNLVSKDTGLPVESKGLAAFNEAATEVLYLPNDHPNTVYYGHADGTTAIGDILGNVYIRDYVHQFFEHNCVPRWAIIIKGAKIDAQLRKTLEDYFQNNIKGKNHQTLVLTMGGALQNVTVDFQKLDVGNKEADFMKTSEMYDNHIMVANEVPASMLGVGEKSTLGSRGLGAAEIFKDYVITPLQQYYARKLNLLFRLGLGVLNAKIEFMELDVRDSLTKAQILQILTHLGYYNINEGRDEYGMAAIKGGDVHIVRIKDGTAVKVEYLPEMDFSENSTDPEETVGIGDNLENNLTTSFENQETRVN